MSSSSRVAASSCRVVVTAPGLSANESAKRSLTSRGWLVSNPGPVGGRTPNEVEEILRHADAAILSSDPVPSSVLEASPQLRVIARLGVGVDNIDLEAATRNGVVVTTTPGLNDETCADHALAMLLATLRRVPEHDASVRRGEWNRGGPLTPWDLHGKRVGVIGYGRIGRAVVRRVAGFTDQIRIFDPFAEVVGQTVCDSLPELLAWADVVTLHLPLTQETAGLIGAREIAGMRPGAILINTSRGGLVVEEALLAALDSGHLRAAALDVFEQEPPVGHSWERHPNLVLSPHIGGLSVEAISSMMQTCIEQVVAVLEGRIPKGVVNPEVFTSLSLDAL